jgi:hypothetical protein
MFAVDMVLIRNCITVIQLVCIIVPKHHTMGGGASCIINMGPRVSLDTFHEEGSPIAARN